MERSTLVIVVDLDKMGDDTRQMEKLDGMDS